MSPSTSITAPIGSTLPLARPRSDQAMRDPVVHDWDDDDREDGRAPNQVHDEVDLDPEVAEPTDVTDPDGVGNHGDQADDRGGQSHRLPPGQVLVDAPSGRREPDDR